MKKSTFPYAPTTDDVNLAKIGTLEARNHFLTEQVQNLEKNISVLNQTIVHLTTHQQQKEEDAKKYSVSILKKDKQMREFLRRLERVGKLVYVLQQYQVVSLITDDDLKQLYESSLRLNRQDDFASTFDEDFDFSVKILNMLQLAFSDLVEKLYQREDVLNYLISELSLGKAVPANTDALNTSFEQNQPIASSSMLVTDESVDEEEQVNNEISDSFIAKANQFLKDIHVRSKDEWKDIKQELNTAASPTFLDTENAETINEKLSSINENYQKINENLHDKDMEILKLRTEVDQQRERTSILMKQLNQIVAAPKETTSRISPSKQAATPKKQSPTPQVRQAPRNQDSGVNTLRKQAHSSPHFVSTAAVPSLNSPTLNSTKTMLYSPSEPSSIRMTSMSRDIPRRPTGLESQDMLQSSDLNLPISREPPTNTPILNEPFEESSEILPVPALQSSNLSATYTRSVPINKRNIFDSIDDSQLDESEGYGMAVSPSLARARQPPPTKPSPAFHPRSPKDVSTTREFRSTSVPVPVTSFSSSLSHPAPVIQPSLPERQSSIPKPSNKPQRKEIATTKSLHSSPEYARHQLAGGPQSSSPPKSRQISPTRSMTKESATLPSSRSEEALAAVPSQTVYDRRRAVETLRKKALEVESLIQQMQN